MNDGRRVPRLILPLIKCTTRASALAAGEQYFFPKKPCKFGHMSPRAVANYHCIACRREASARDPMANRERQSRYRAKYPERAAAAQHVAYRKRSAHYKNAAKQWRQNNLDQAREIKRNKKARRKGAAGSHTAAEISALAQKQKYQCVACCVSIKHDFHVDHVIPLIAGGDNYISNIQLLCPTCNMTKGAKLPDAWARYLGRLL